LTNNERELVAALQADIQKWEFVAGFFEHSVREFDVIGGRKMSGTDYARGLRQQIIENRTLVEKVKNG
jgi:hypothetical protein